MGGQFGPNRTSGSGTAFSTEGATTVGAASVQIAAANDNRIELFIQNDHATQTVYLSLGGTAQVNKGIRLDPGAGMILSSYAGIVRAIASGAGTVVLTAEV